jgi:hypothetical protein
VLKERNITDPANSGKESDMKKAIIAVATVLLAASGAVLAQNQKKITDLLQKAADSYRTSH